jgi:hypothetical protein
MSQYRAIITYEITVEAFDATNAIQVAQSQIETQSHGGNLKVKPTYVTAKLAQPPKVGM